MEIPVGGGVGGGWVATSKVLKKSIELNCNFQGGGGCKQKKTFCGRGMNILWTTH